jgi:hypothetical protein
MRTKFLQSYKISNIILLAMKKKNQKHINQPKIRPCAIPIETNPKRICFFSKLDKHYNIKDIHNICTKHCHLYTK